MTSQQDFERQISSLDNVIDRMTITCKNGYAGCFETVMEAKQDFERFCIVDRAWETPQSLKYPLQVIERTKRLAEVFQRIEDVTENDRFSLRNTNNPAHESLLMSHHVLWNMLAYHARSDGEILLAVQVQQRNLPKRAQFTLDSTVETAQEKYGRSGPANFPRPKASEIEIPKSVWGHDREEVEAAGKARMICVEEISLEEYFACFFRHISIADGSAISDIPRFPVSERLPASNEKADRPNGCQTLFLLAFVIAFFVWRLSRETSPMPVHSSTEKVKRG